MHQVSKGECHELKNGNCNNFSVILSALFSVSFNLGQTKPIFQLTSSCDFSREFGYPLAEIFTFTFKTTSPLHNMILDDLLEYESIL